MGLTRMQQLHLKSSRGFTLVELMVVIAVLAIIASIGAPSFANLMRTTTLNAASNDLADALRYARSEAVQRNTTVGVVPVAGGFSEGWSVCVDADCDVSGNVLKVNAEGMQGVTLACSGGVACDGTVNFAGRGTGSAGQLEVTHAADASLKRCVRILLSGSVSLTDQACPGG